jgi:Na+(H+)/acetate symporter ActP
VTGPDHFQHAERLLAHAETMMAEHVGDERLGELLRAAALAVAMSTAHGPLAVAAAIGLSANMDVIDASSWRDVAGTRVTDSGGQ